MRHRSARWVLGPLLSLGASLGCGAAPPAPVVPAVVSAASFTERYEGHYVCPQGPTGLVLELRLLGDAVAHAVFRFHPLPENPAVPAGSFTLTGTWRAGGSLSLVPERWIEAPKDYVMVGLSGTLDRVTGLFLGSIDAEGCGGFSLRRVP
jgi:hypothetical protein